MNCELLSCNMNPTLGSVVSLAMFLHTTLLFQRLQSSPIYFICATRLKQLIYQSNCYIILSFFATGRPSRFRAMIEKFSSDWLCRELAGLLLLTSGLIFQQILLHQKETNAAKKANLNKEWGYDFELYFIS